MQYVVFLKKNLLVIIFVTHLLLLSAVTTAVLFSASSLSFCHFIYRFYFSQCNNSGTTALSSAKFC